jgi:hypothetical protein
VADAPQLYHFTCEHAFRRIGRQNCLLIPQVKHPLLGCKVTWLTTEAEPDRMATGLTGTMLACDRMQHRYLVTGTALSACREWLGSPERRNAPQENVRTLESCGDPEHWWITDRAVSARWDRAYAGAAA